MRKTGDLEAKDLTGVEESSLDKEALAQKANQVTGDTAVRSRVYCDGQKILENSGLIRLLIMVSVNHVEDS